MINLKWILVLATILSASFANAFEGKILKSGQSALLCVDSSSNAGKIGQIQRALNGELTKDVIIIHAPLDSYDQDIQVTQPFSASQITFTNEDMAASGGLTGCITITKR